MLKWLKKMKIKKKKIMMNNNLFPIAKEGISYIAYSILAFIIFAFLDLDFLQFFAFLTSIFFIFIFRNPERQITVFQKASVVSPVDGIVHSIEELEDGTYGYKVEINSSYLDVSLLRIPLTSTLSDIQIYKGARLSKFSPLSSSINEHAELIFTDEDSNSIKVSHSLNQSLKGIDISVIKAQNLHQGARYGLILSGTTTLYLPKNFRLNLSVGSELKAAEGLVGYFTN